MTMSIDLDFRPRSYADFADPVSLAVSGINGQMRRTMVRDMLTAEGEQRELYDAALGDIEPEILEERPADLSSLRSLSPIWMGGEYLTPLKPGETEIARVVLRSTTMDVFSVRARWTGRRYHYRVVDEYESAITLCRKTSLRPLTLRQVIELLDSAGGDVETKGAGLVVAWWNQELDYGQDLQECTDFAWVESEIYGELAAWYEERARLWREERE
jgi:hypothetical protein